MKKHYPIIFLIFLIVVPVASLSAQYYTMLGPATITATSSVTYSYAIDPIDAVDTWFTSPNWVVTSQGTITSQYLSSDKLTAYAVVKWNTVGAATVTFKQGTRVTSTKAVTVTCPTIEAPVFDFENYLCGTSGSVLITASPRGSGTVVRWYTESGSYIQEGQLYNTPVLTSTTTYYITSYNATMGCESSPRTPVTVILYPIPAAPAAASVVNCQPGSVALAATPASDANSIIWYATPTGEAIVATGTSYTTPSLSTTTSYYAASYNTTAGCISTERTPVTATVVNMLRPLNLTDDIILGSGTITLDAGVRGNEADTEIQWFADATSVVTPIATGSSYTTPPLTTTTSYYARARSITSNCVSSLSELIAVVKPILASASVQTDAIRAKGKKTDADLVTLTDAEKTTTFEYLDGMARVNQQVVLRGSPFGKDIVQPVEYDAYGRISQHYAPYIPATTNGAFHSTFKAEQATFYTAANDKVANDNAAYALTKYEDSPLGRAVEQGSVGQAFQPGTNHTYTAIYSFNTGATANAAEEVRQLNADGSSTGFYAANILSRVESKDENGNKEITYSNAQGQTLAIKKQLDEVIDGVTVNWLETYYIYDDFGRVNCMISPKGTVALKASGWSFTQSIKDNYVHHFLYDKHGRLVQKKIPGQAWVYFVYDALDRLVLTQDGLLRASGKWSFIKYDNRGRIILQGLYKNTTNTTRAAVQTLVDALYTAANVTYPASAMYDVRGGALHGYTNISFPKTNADNTALEILAVNFYDGYDFDDADGVADYTYTNQGLAGESVTSPASLYGVATGSKRLVLGTTTWLYTYIFYDEYGRPVQVRSNNHLSAAVDNLVTQVYDFEGKVTVQKQYHNAGAGKITTITNKYTYDNQGRPLKVYQNNNGAATDQLLVQYDYNELGQLVDKKLHNTTGNTFLQSVDYRYTIRGQLESINNAQLAVNAANNDEATDYFGMELLYNTADASLGNSAAWNGNISAVKWKGIGGSSGTTDQRGYTYAYDKSGKLKTATSKMYTGSAWTKEAGTLSESMTYDQNGNIRSLLRNQRKHRLVGTTPSYTSDAIDNLSYTYSGSIGEQLLKVEDAAASTGGFVNGTNAATEYTYDVNGNALSDLNKGISNITYNILGKPAVMTFTDGRKIEYIYDVFGSKLTMKSYAAGSSIPQTTTDYVNGFVYENNTLSFFGSPEGRVVNNNGTLQYQYAIADNQGNTRVVFSSVTPTADAPLATLEGDANDGASQYTINAANIVSFGSANHTTGGSKVVRMNQSYKIGPSKSVKVYPGDKIDIEVWEYHEGASGFGTTGTPLNTLITNVAAAFNGVSGAIGESGAIYGGVNTAITAYGTGGNQGDSRPAAYLNYILFDKNYNVLDAGWQLAPASTFTKQKISFPTKNIKEEGYIYTWLSYDDASDNWVYFDDFKVTHTKTNVIQYNDYYPFGLQASTSWTRETNKNNFLYNEASELNTTSGWYETMYRGYDATLGRFMQVDPLAHVDHSVSPFAYAGNNPILFNDPTGLLKATREELNNFIDKALAGNGGTWSDDGGQHMFGSSNEADMWVAAFQQMMNDGGGGSVEATYGIKNFKYNGATAKISYGVTGYKYVQASKEYEAQQGGPGDPSVWKSAWDSYWWNLADAIGLHSKVLNKGVGIIIIGSNGQKVQVDYSQKDKGNKMVGVLDLNDNSNLLSVLSMLVISNELDGVSTFVNIRQQDPRNRYDKNGLMYYYPIPGYPGYYTPGPSTLTDNYYYKYPNIAFKYVMKGSDHYMIEVIHPAIQK
ncbi:DUF6443 domain-containing protein [Ohtaekwangia kribbensis]|uniref:DUF6443 domain-containing protein n=1 Tax=Ohtaekwangia kribbensis TaxID=688913 RepID=A0ABW3KBB7_9BACT